MNLFTKQKQTDMENTYGYQSRWGENKLEVWD